MKQWKRFFSFLIAVSLVMATVPVVFAQDTEKVNINTATIEELVQLNKIGQKYAERIVAYREKNGPFEQPEDIVKVKGIGPKVFELNKDRIMVEKPAKQK